MTSSPSRPLGKTSSVLGESGARHDGRRHSIQHVRLGREGRRAEERLRRALDPEADGDDRGSELRFLSALHVFRHRAGNYIEMLKLARRSEAVAAQFEDPSGQAAEPSRARARP